MATPESSERSRVPFQRAFWFTYHATERETRVEAERKRTKRKKPDFSRHLHQVRDGLAFAELSSVLALGQSECGYGGAILNLPARAYPDGEIPTHSVECGRTDLIVLVTRPPLNDNDDPRSYKRELRSHTELEDKVLASLHRWFLDYCSRVEVRLHARLRELLHTKPPRIAQRGDIEYSKKTGTYRSEWTRQILGTPSADEGGDRLLTGGYLAFTPEGWPGGPGILAAFGMGGVDTMTWTRALRVYYPDLVRATVASDRLSICFAEWTPVDPPIRPESLGLLDVDACKPAILFQATSSRIDPPQWELH